MKDLTVNAQKKSSAPGEKLISYRYSGGISGVAVLFSIVLEILFIIMSIVMKNESIWLVLSILGLAGVISSIIIRIKTFNQYGNKGFEIYSDKIVFIKEPVNDLLIEQRSIPVRIIIVLSGAIGPLAMYVLLLLQVKPVIAVLVGSLFVGISTVYSIYWLYLMVKNTRAIKFNSSSCVGEMLLLLFVPFYSFYWYFTRGELIKNELSKRGYASISSGVLYLLFSIFGFSFISLAMMQMDFNRVPADLFKIEAPKEPEDSYTFDQVNKMYIKGCVFYVETSKGTRKMMLNSRDFRWNLASLLGNNNL